ncbi:DUF2057 domain-containing protein [Paraburkholderia lycopersici]|uniref:Zinc-ribbon domain-containing protein n=1 Tax=Paraburkholderia lycopersici TaxID=416944 RepID=A0A1G6HE54_9BURK|nr:DUF2057 domain-containing protein [Paraburkholderia lycopersici]SDB92378.1 hypothetical protein SAMN05421548_102211 [Paraburkholderia lycopersici]
MSAQITRDQSIPIPCKRCGGLLYQYADLCPYCGADHPLGAVARTGPKATFRALGSTAAAPPSPAAAKVSPAGTSTFDHRSVKADYQHNYQLEHGWLFWRTGRGTFTKGILLVCVLLAITYAAYLLPGQIRRQESAIDEQSTHSSGGSVSFYTARPQPDLTPQSADTGPQSTTPKPYAVPHFKDVADSLRAARASLAGNNLSEAKAAGNAALAHDAENEDAREIQRDIAAHEQRRDSALQIADQCARQNAWACVQQRASEALAIDSSSPHAQSLMERAILATAWTPRGSPNSQRGGAQAAAPAPLPSATNTTNAPANAYASARAEPVNPPATASTPTPASSGSNVDAEERAILQFGWKHASPAAATH